MLIAILRTTPSVHHYNDVIMSAVASQITIVYSSVYSGTDERKFEGSTSLAFVTGDR